MFSKAERRGPDLTVIRGLVTQVGKDIATTPALPGIHGGTVVSVPELWLADADGKETRLSGSLIRHALAGHQVVVVTEPPSAPVALINLSSDQVFMGETSPRVESLGSRMSTLPFFGVGAAILLVGMYLGVGDAIIAMIEPFYPNKRSAGEALWASYPYVLAAFVLLIAIILLKQHEGVTQGEKQRLINIEACVKAELRSLGRNADGARQPPQKSPARHDQA